jgi:hypothetical protein
VVVEADATLARVAKEMVDVAVVTTMHAVTTVTTHALTLASA